MNYHTFSEKFFRLINYFRSYRNLVGISRFGNWLLFGSLIGIVSGLGAILFTYGIELSSQFLLGIIIGFQVPSVSNSNDISQVVTTRIVMHRWLFFVVPALGGLIVGWLVFTFAPETEGHGTDEVIKSFHQDRGIIRRRVPIVKAITSIITISTGGSAGKEGPVAQIGAGFGSFLADLLKLPDRDRRLMVIAGMGGGIGSIFKAPLGGALFATEVLYREPDFEYEGLIPAIISSIVAYSIYGIVFGWGAIFSTPPLSFDQPLQLLLYLLFGVLAAGVGIIYVRFFYDTRDKIFRRLKIKKPYKPAIGGILLGVLAYFFPPILGGGYSWIQLALFSKVALSTMILFPFLKIIATSLTIGSGGSGGVFAPSLVIGGMLGGAFGELAKIILPGWNLQPAAFIMVGMAGFFAGIAKVPISSLIMVAEMTGSYGLLVPTMLVSTITFLLTGRVSIYERQVNHRAQSPAHRGEFLNEILDGIRVQDCMVPVNKQQIIPENMHVKELLKIVSSTNHQYFITVDNQNKMAGFISLDDIRQIMLEPHVDQVLIARDLAFRNVPSLKPDDTLSTALNLFTLNSIDELPVISDEDHTVISFIRKKDLVMIYDQALLSNKELS